MNEAEKKALAYEIASTLQDVKSLGVHEYIVAKYSEEFLREILEIVMHTPKENIKRSRAAYYMHLVKNRGNAL